MIKNRDQIDQAGRAFYWRRNPNERPMIAESTRPDIVIGYREGYEQALRDAKAALEPQEPLSSPFKDHRYWSRLKEREVRKDRPAPWCGNHQIPYNEDGLCPKCLEQSNK